MTTLLMTPEIIAIDTRGTTDQSTDDGVQKWHNIPNLGLIGFLVGSASVQFELITRLRNGEKIETMSERMRKGLPRYRQMFFLGKEGQLMQFIPSTGEIIQFQYPWMQGEILADGSGMATIKGAYARLGPEDMDGVFLANSLVDMNSSPSYFVFDRATLKVSFQLNDKSVSRGFNRVTNVAYERMKNVCAEFNKELS